MSSILLDEVTISRVNLVDDLLLEEKRFRLIKEESDLLEKFEQENVQIEELDVGLEGLVSHRAHFLERDRLWRGKRRLQ